MRRVLASSLSHCAAACNCASTSTAPPCRHAPQLTVTRSIGSSTEQPNCSAHHDVSSLDYTAPLWSHASSTAQHKTRPEMTALGSGNHSRWFKLHTSWSGWMHQSRASTTSSTLSPLSPSRQSRAPSLVKSADTSDQDDLDAMNKYIAFRGIAVPGSAPEHTSAADLRTSSTLGDAQLNSLRAQAKRRGLTMVEHQIKMDQHDLTASADAGEDEQVKQPLISNLPSSEPAFQVDPPPRIEAARDTSSHLPASIDGRQILQCLYDNLRNGQLTLPDLFRTEVAHHTSDLLSDAERLELLWRYYQAQTTSAAGEEGDNLSLAFLAYLAMAGDASYLNLALQILRHLLESNIVDSAAVSPPPQWIDEASSPVNQAVALRVVFLRTATSTALERGEHELALHCVKTLVELKADHDVPVDAQRWQSEQRRQDANDYTLLLETGAACVRDLKLHLNQLYDPASLSARQSSSMRLLDLLAGLLIDQVPRLIVAPAMPSSLASLLNIFVDQCANYKRLDIVAQVWRVWGTPGERDWRIKKRRKLGLARYLAGDDFAEPSQQGTFPDLSVVSSKIRRVTVRAREFALLVQETGDELRAGTGSLDEWSDDAKRAWIELLVQSRASQRSRLCYNEAKAAFEHWKHKGLVLGGHMLLVLAKAAVKFGDRAFAQRLAGDFVGTLTGPESPYRREVVKRRRSTGKDHAQEIMSTATPTQIPHYDLTALAGVYALLGDTASVAQVYRQMLAQKILPDQRDVDVILESTPVMDQIEGQEDPIVSFVRWAHKLGVVVTRMHLERMIVRLCQSGDSNKTDRSKPVKEIAPLQPRIKAVLALGDELGLNSSDCAQLHDFAQAQLRTDKEDHAPRTRTVRRHLIEQMRHSATGHVHPARVVRLLDDAYARNDWRSALAIHMTAVQTYGFQDDYTIRRTLGIMLRQIRSESLAGREAIRRGLVAVLEALFPASVDQAAAQALCVVVKRETANAVFRAALKLDDLDAIERLVDRVDVEPSAAVKSIVRRWAIAKGGVERVEVMRGWLGEEQRHCAREKAEREEKRAEHAQLMLEVKPEGRHEVEDSGFPRRRRVSM